MRLLGISNKLQDRTGVSNYDLTASFRIFLNFFFLYMKFGVLIAVSMKVTLLGHLSPCSLVHGAYGGGERCAQGVGGEA
jgi:hypothetical protein